MKTVSYGLINSKGELLRVSSGESPVFQTAHGSEWLVDSPQKAFRAKMFDPFYMNADLEHPMHNQINLGEYEIIQVKLVINKTITKLQPPKNLPKIWDFDWIADDKIFGYVSCYEGPLRKIYIGDTYIREFDVIDSKMLEVRKIDKINNVHCVYMTPKEFKI